MKDFDINGFVEKAIKEAIKSFFKNNIKSVLIEKGILGIDSYNIDSLFKKQIEDGFLFGGTVSGLSDYNDESDILFVDTDDDGKVEVYVPRFHSRQIKVYDQVYYGNGVIYWFPKSKEKSVRHIVCLGYLFTCESVRPRERFHDSIAELNKILGKNNEL